MQGGICLVLKCIAFAGTPHGKATEFNTSNDVSLHYTGRGKGGKGDLAEAAPPDAVIQEIDAQELNRVFISRFAEMPHRARDYQIDHILLSMI